MSSCNDCKDNENCGSVLKGIDGWTCQEFVPKKGDKK